jgi:hypothetical protein
VLSHGNAGVGIDCSNLVQQSLLAAGYNVPYLNTDAIYRNGSVTATALQYYQTVPLNQLQPGDVIVFQGHMGIVQEYSSETGGGFFYSSQSSTGPAIAPFTTTGSGYFGGTRAALIGLEPLPSTEHAAGAQTRLS